LLPLSFQPLFRAQELRPSRVQLPEPLAPAPLALLAVVVAVAELAPPSYRNLRTLE
jgi:hypothetical protein